MRRSIFIIYCFVLFTGLLCSCGEETDPSREDLTAIEKVDLKSTSQKTAKIENRSGQDQLIGTPSTELPAHQLREGEKILVRGIIITVHAYDAVISGTLRDGLQFYWYKLPWEGKPEGLIIEWELADNNKPVEVPDVSSVGHLTGARAIVGGYIVKIVSSVNVPKDLFSYVEKVSSTTEAKRLLSAVPPLGARTTRDGISNYISEEHSALLLEDKVIIEEDRFIIASNVLFWSYVYEHEYETRSMIYRVIETVSQTGDYTVEEISPYIEVVVYE